MKRLYGLLLTAAACSGCLIMVPGHLYPIHGPLSTSTPAPIYDVSLSGVLGSGTMSATLGNGEICSGSWTAVAPNDPTASSLSAAWDSVYGPGFFVAKVLGSHVFERGVLSGNRGTTLNVEFYDLEPGKNRAAAGIAKDNEGNVFKLTF